MVQHITDHLSDTAALAARLAGFDVVVTMRERTPITEELLSRLPRLRLITTTGMANASIDVEAAGRRGIRVCGTTRSTNAAAELACALIMAVAKDIPGNNRDVCDGLWQERIGIDLDGAVLGILGVGKLGSNMAGFARAFGMQPLGWSSHLTQDRAAAAGAELVGEAALVSALFEGVIAAAAVDVYDVEPLPGDSALRSAPNLILSPHIGFVTERAHRTG